MKAQYKMINVELEIYTGNNKNRKKITHIKMLSIIVTNDIQTETDNIFYLSDC